MTPVVPARNSANSIRRDSFDHQRRQKDQSFFEEADDLAPGDSSDAVFYIQKRRLRLTFEAKSGNEATIGI
jgi:hypothetical protein